MILDDFEELLKNFVTVSNVLAHKIPLIDKFFVLSLDLRVLLKQPLASEGNDFIDTDFGMWAMSTLIAEHLFWRSAALVDADELFG